MCGLYLFKTFEMTVIYAIDVDVAVIDIVMSHMLGVWD